MGNIPKFPPSFRPKLEDYIYLYSHGYEGTAHYYHDPREGFPSRGICSLGAMGSGPGQDQEFPCRRGRGRDGDPVGFQKWVEKTQIWKNSVMIEFPRRQKN